MVGTLDDIERQAQQGSVAAIIQVLNAQLADFGVRARAVVARGFLQILCEADTQARLEQADLIEKLQNILNNIQPRYVRRVRVNARLVSEQQLLWLDEIERDPEGQLLWTTEFSLTRPRIDQQIRNTWADWRDRNHHASIVLADTAQREQQKRRLWQSTIGAGGLLVFVCLAGWVVYDFLGLEQRHQPSNIALEQPPIQPDQPEETTDLSQPSANELEANSSNPVSTSAASGQGLQVPQPTVESSQPAIAPDPFAQAVRLAEEAVAAGQTATTVDEWMELASQWQRASELMNQVLPNDDRYATAQDRTTVYLQNSVDSRKQAELARQAQDN